MEEANPMTYMGGQLAGGVTSGLLLPGGAAAKAATAGGRALQAAKTGATVGAEFGAIQGLGDSEADITGGAGEYAKELASDVGTGASAGAVLGGILGGSISAVSDAGKWITGWLKDHKATSHMINTYKAGKEGFNIKPSSYADEVNPNRPSYNTEKDLAVEDLANRIHEADKALGKRISDSLNVAEKNNVVVKIDDELETAIRKMESLEKTFMTDTGEQAALGLDDMLARVKSAASMADDDAAMVLAAVEEGSLAPEVARDLIAAKNGGLSPNKAKDILNDLQVYIDHFNTKATQGTGTKRVVKQLNEFRTMLRTKIGKEVEGYNNAAAKFQEFRKSMPEKLLSKKSLRSNNPMIKDLEAKNVNDKLKDLIDDTAESVAIGDIGEDGVRKVTDIKHYLDQVKQREGKSEILDILGYENGTGFADEIDKLQNMAGTMIKSKAASPLDPNRSTTMGSGVVDYLLSAGQGLNYRALNAAGRATQSPSLKKAGSLYNASMDTLKKAVNKLQKSNIQGLGQLGNSLNKAIAEGNQSKRNAALFVILQRPDARKALGYNAKGDKE